MSVDRASGSGPTAPAVPADGLLHPLPLAAIAILVLNDHALKAAFPGFVTGKLSDVAGLAFFPLFLQAGAEVGLMLLRRPWGPSRRVLGLAILATAIVFALVKLDTPVTDLYRIGLGWLQWPFRAIAALAGGGALPAPAEVRIVADPSDLLALPAVLAGAAVRRRPPQPPDAPPPPGS